MDLQTEPRPKASTRVSPPFSGTLHDLLQLDGSTLARLYAEASVPRVQDLSGDLRGRMLAIPQLPPLVATFVRMLASHARFPWRGKSFQHTSVDRDRGEGLNRIFSDTFRRYRFETFVGPSRAGAFDAVQLDYDHPSNPFFIRPIKDEVRELRPGLWLGQAWLQLRKGPHLVLYFGLAK